MASNTIDPDAQPRQSDSALPVSVGAGVDDDSKTVIETELGDARRGLASAQKRGHPDSIAAYENLITELEKANSPVVANDTADMGNLPFSNPADSPLGNHDTDAERVDNEIVTGTEQPCLIQPDADAESSGFITEAELQAAYERFKTKEELKAGRPLTDDELRAVLNASTEDPIGDGAAFDMLIDGESEEDAGEPVVQKVTNNDGSVEPDPTQPLLIDDVSAGPPVIK